MKLELTITENDAGRRVDRVLRKALPQLALSAIHRLLRKKLVKADGKVINAEGITKAGQIIVINGIDIEIDIDIDNSKKNDALTAQKKLSQESILYKGGGIIIINKESGITSHGKNSLETAVLAYLKDSVQPSLSFKPGPLHRLDKETSGIIMFSTSLDGARTFSRYIQNKQMIKTYITILEGALSDDCTWEDFLVRDKYLKKTFAVNDGIDAKNAVSHVHVIAYNRMNTLAAIQIETGRTHQIRACSALHGHPLLGDVKYGGTANNREKKPPFFLHAYTLEFPQDISFTSTGKLTKITAPLPEYFLQKIKILFGNVSF